MPDCTHNLIWTSDSVIACPYYCLFMLVYYFLYYSSMYYHHMLTHAICTCIFPFILTHSLSHFLTTLNLHIHILDDLFYYSGVRRDRTCCEELEFPSIHFGILVFLFIPFVSLIFLILYHYQSLFHSLFICYHVWAFICSIVVILIYHSDYITCSGYFRLSLYV